MSRMLFFLRWLNLLNSRCPYCLGELNKSYLFDTCTECNFGKEKEEKMENKDLGYAFIMRYKKYKEKKEEIERLRNT